MFLDSTYKEDDEYLSFWVWLIPWRIMSPRLPHVAVNDRVTIFSKGK